MEMTILKKVGFEELHQKFEERYTDLYKLQQEPGFARYLLVRSLDIEHLQYLTSGMAKVRPKKKRDDLYKEVFESEITEDDLIEYINIKYDEVRTKRVKQERYLSQILEDIGQVKCGVRNDDLHDLIKGLVRDKTIRTKGQLTRRISTLLKGTVNSYILWQYYNQAANDLIEHTVNNHSRVIPTLRKIKYVDFMIKIDGKIIPFDLKITHISDDYFDLFKKGLAKNDHIQVGDDYGAGGGRSEIEIIKEYYKSMKKKGGVGNYGDLTKLEMIDNLRKLKDQSTLDFLTKLTESRAAMVEQIEKDLASVEWWNYKFQGERLFKNNNRFFVFLTYKTSFEDARPLKGNLEEIKQKVIKHLDEIRVENLNTVNYTYEKHKALNGKYTANSTSVLVVG